ncbi:M48 family metalloprotease [Blastopirellula retiformator]|uniref:Protease HtpX n=1 Tax=Blastopirellula retiformator TaxID=2527970 RepID=A0A5C5UW86_9BACT|nr:M48 family metalloprotease [Blastopirellula retiformator]TWT29830.1 Protease HtpX [Blastopirellula retiformator]
MIQFRCSGCQAAFNVSSDKQGKKGKCPKCGEIIQIPKQEAQVPKASPAAPHISTAQPARRSPGGVQRKSAKPAAPAAAARRTESVMPKQKLSDDQLRAAVMGSFRGSFERPKTRPLYVISALIVSVVMVALPLIYLAFIGLIGYGVYYHLVNHVGMLGVARGRAAIFVFLLYIAPPVVASIGILFMLKPLFARPAYEHRTRSLTEKSDPLLFEFVAKICSLVGAPFPKRIDIDDQMNASASFRNGMWSVLRGNDLVLTIGVPLAAGLTTRQFAGVLAHEFGHFSQGAGMRLTYVVRSISHWFARVVYMRDEWDVWLAETAEGVDLRIGVFLYLTMLFVWISRGLLWILMYIGHFAAGFLLRQMEYDADQYEIRLAGSTAFQQTSQRMRLINAAYGLSIEMLSAVFQRGAMVDDITAFLKVQLRHLPDEIKRDVKTSIESERTGLFDTHPCDRDRIAAAVAAQMPGVFHHEGLAVDLFGNFERLSKNVTWDRYCQLTGNRVAQDKLTPYRDLINEFKLDIFGEHSKENMKKEEALAIQHHLANPDRIPFDN